jgi:tetratricopeptide (TPR) repeat protein
MLSAQTRRQYADWLYGQGDYFRAVSEYKELLFFAPTDQDADSLRFMMGKAYYRSGKHNNSISEFSALVERPVAPALRSAAFDLIALNYLNLSLPNQALYYSSEALKDSTREARFTNGVIRANLYEWDNAASVFGALSAVSDGRKDELSSLAEENLAAVNAARDLPKKSPILSMLMSAVIPGSGQLYAGHSVDALQSFAFVGSFAYMSYIAYRYDKQNGNGYYNFGASISLASLFYIANLIGAERTATYYNVRQQQEVVKKLNQRSLLIYR